MRKENIDQKQLQKQKSQISKIRVIAGQFKGRNIEFLPDEITFSNSKVSAKKNIIRPTKNFARENLFNWLNHRVIFSQARVLDLFAGSGSLGIEALSRGAKHVLFTDTVRHNINFIEHNLQHFGCDKERYEARCADAFSILSANISTQHKFNLVFVDPPFTQNLHLRLFEYFEKTQILQDGAWIFIEFPREQSNLESPKSWNLEKEKFSGAVCSRLFSYQVP